MVSKVRRTDGPLPHWADWVTRPLYARRLRRARARLIAMRSLRREQVGEMVHRDDEGTERLLRDVRDATERRP